MSKKGRHSGDEPRTRWMNLRMTETEFQELEEYAARHDISKTQALLNAFQEVKNQEDKD